MNVPKSKGRVAEDTLKWTAIVISALSLAVSVSSFLTSYLAYKKSKYATTTAAMERWDDIGSSLPTADACINFLLRSDEGLFQKLLGEHSVDIPKLNSDADLVARCIDIADPPTSLTRQQVEDLRRIVGRKLNSYEDIYHIVANGEADSQQICDRVRSGFEAGAKSLALRIFNSSPETSYIRKRDVDYQAKAAEGQLCRF